MDYLFLHPARILTLLAVAALLFGLPLRSRFVRAAVWAVAILGLVSYAVTVARDDMSDGVRAWDLEYFWDSGRLMAEGRSPYDQPSTMNPPTAFPLYRLIGSGSFNHARIAWTLFLSLGAMTLVVLARRLLAEHGDTISAGLEAPIVGLLTAVVCLSRSNRFGIELGQLALPVTLVLFWALFARLRGKPVQAGVGLALASIKTPTLIPMLVLFLRKKDWKVWLAMSVAGVALVLSMTAPWDIVPRCQECLRNIAGTRQEGELDDYSIVNSRNNSMVGFNVLFNRLGISDRGTVALLQLAALIALTGWVGWLILGPRRLETAAALCVASIFAMLFMYHRIYDLLLLTLPLIYTFGRARSEKGLRRWLFVGCAACLLLALNLREWWVADARARVLKVDDAWSTLLRVTVLPYLTWLVLFSLVLLVTAERLRTRAMAREGEAPAESTREGEAPAEPGS